jgi:hypothetical protein
MNPLEPGSLMGFKGAVSSAGEARDDRPHMADESHNYAHLGTLGGK